MRGTAQRSRCRSARPTGWAARWWLRTPGPRLLLRRMLDVGQEQPEGVLVEDHRGCDPGRMHRVHPDPVRREFECERAQSARRRCAWKRCRRRRSECPWRPAVELAQHDRPAGTLLDQVRGDGLAGQPEPLEVDVEHLVPVAFADEMGLLAENERCRRSRWKRCRPSRVRRRRSCTTCAPRRSHAHRRCGRRCADRAPPRRGPSRRGLRPVPGYISAALGNVGAHVEGDDVGALLREPDRVAATLPACRSGDQGYLARTVRLSSSSPFGAPPQVRPSR